VAKVRAGQPARTRHPRSSKAGHELRLLDDAIAALPPALRRRLMVTCDGAGASHQLP
jgi:hypothetical protein